MKSWVFCLALLVGCSHATQANTDESLTYQSNYVWEDQVINDMTYRFYFKWGRNQGSGSIIVINLTKDQLEVENLRLQNAALRKAAEK